MSTTQINNKDDGILNNNNNNNNNANCDTTTTATTATGRTTLNDDDETTTTSTSSSSSFSIMDRFDKALSLVETSPERVIHELTIIQEQIAYQSIYSKNEDITELSNEALRLLVVEYYLGIAYMNLPLNVLSDPDGFYKRQQNLIYTCNLFIEFLRRLEVLSNNDISTTSTSAAGDSDNTNHDDNTSLLLSSTSTILLSKDEIQQYRELVDVMDHMTKQLNSSSSSSLSSSNTNNSNPMVIMQTIMNMIPPVHRDIKIARHNAKDHITKQYNKLRQLYERRKRLNLQQSDEIMDGYDSDSLLRAMAIANIIICKYNTFDEWMNILRELPMIVLQVQRQKDYTTTQNRYNNTSNGRSSNQQQQSHSEQPQRSPPPPPSKPLEVTHITQNPLSGQLRIQKEVIKSTVFRPGWNQPTMSLEELAYREVDDAIRRDEQQKVAEANRSTQPRRYKELVKAEQDDDADLVDASAPLDRQWDDWKDENPRGSGNKRGDVGDRNF